MTPHHRAALLTLLEGMRVSPATTTQDNDTLNIIDDMFSPLLMDIFENKRSFLTIPSLSLRESLAYLLGTDTNGNGAMRSLRTSAYEIVAPTTTSVDSDQVFIFRQHLATHLPDFYQVISTKEGILQTALKRVRVEATTATRITAVPSSQSRDGATVNVGKPLVVAIVALAYAFWLLNHTSLCAFNKTWTRADLANPDAPNDAHCIANYAYAVYEASLATFLNEIRPLFVNTTTMDQIKSSITANEEKHIDHCFRYVHIHHTSYTSHNAVSQNVVTVTVNLHRPYVVQTFGFVNHDLSMFIADMALVWRYSYWKTSNSPKVRLGNPTTLKKRLQAAAARNAKVSSQALLLVLTIFWIARNNRWW